MTETNMTLLVLIFGFAILLGFFCWGKRAWIGLILVGAFLFRGLIAMILESGLKYDFVWDSLHYEYRAWLLAQKWMSADTFLSLTNGGSYQFNDYELLLAGLFWALGKATLLATIVNCLFSVLAIFFIYRIQTDFFFDRSDERRATLNLPAIFTTTLLSLYPAFLIWSATNIRDPLYFLFSTSFFYFFIRIFSRRVESSLWGRAGSTLLCALSFWGIMGLRSYLNEIYLGSILIGFAIYPCLKKFRPWKVIATTGILGLAVTYLYQFLEPSEFTKFLMDVDSRRKAFGNLKLLDFVTKSSFGLDRDLRSVTDLLLFLPNSLSHYFFGPFPWEIVDTVQAISFVETLLVFALTYPTYLGIKRIYRRAPFETTMILTFVAILVLAQSLVISNMGTIFRHRTLPFLFLSAFTGEGLYEISRQNFQTLFKAEYWRARAARSQYLRRLEQFWV
jgi:hypothetical protein